MMFCSNNNKYKIFPKEPIRIFMMLASILKFSKYCAKSFVRLLRMEPMEPMEPKFYFGLVGTA